MFSYFDTQLTRLGGPNFEEMPINKPVVEVTNNQRDGIHRFQIDKGTTNYHPNRYDIPKEAPISRGYNTTEDPVKGRTVRALGPKFAEHFNQARLFYNSLCDWEKQHLMEAARFELGHVIDQGIRERTIELFNHIDFDFAVSIAKSIGVTPPSQFLGSTFDRKSPHLSQNNTVKNTIASRKIAFLLSPGYNSTQLNEVKSLLQHEGAESVLIGPTLGVQAEPSDLATATFFTTRSIQYDGLVLVGGSQYPYLKEVGQAMAFVLETFKHCKGMVALGEAIQFLQDLQLITPSPKISSQGVVTVPALSSSDNLRKLLIEAFGFRHFDRDITQIPC
jgi:catalase